jgi:galactose mutarotase-like enzyme
MWQADSHVWPRHAPVLFPLVGRLKNDSYSYENKSYQLSQHGFARDLEFTLLQENKTQVVFELCSDEHTKQKFPFDFKFRIIYTLIDAVVDIKYEIDNISNGQLYFSVGAHPGFRCPLLPNETMADYYLQFERNQFELTVLEGGLRSDLKRSLSIPNNQLHIQSNLFDNDALVFEGGQINSVSLHSNINEHIIEMTCKNWPFFGIWSKKGSAEFICLEPWMGIADGTKSTGNLQEKTGIICLKPRSSFECSHSISFK